MKLRPLVILIPLAASIVPSSAASGKVSFGSSPENTSFETETTPAPASNDAATGATFKVITGKADPNSAPVSVLNDGKIPRDEDEPSSNFFFSGSGGRLLVDLGKPIDLATLATYSWHNGSRSAQNYQVYAADGTAKDFVAEPGADVAPEKSGWSLIGKVDTSANKPGQHAAVISPDSGKSLGSFRYVLFDIQPNKESGFNNTFFSEIDITDANGPTLVRIEKPKVIKELFTSKDKKFRYTLDATEAPDLQEWCGKHLIPVLDEWYPKIIEMLPVDGITPSHDITFTLKDSTNLPGHLKGVPAYASGNSVVFNINFMRAEKSGEAIGAGIHEIVHVVQFGGNREQAAERKRVKRPPTWVTEGVADYIRWFLYEPQSKGAEITERNVRRAKYDDSYRVTGNFFDWVIKNHEKDLMRKLNVATHEGYSEELWKEWTGKTLEELGADWKKANFERLGLKE
ncbi:hypothetical protein JIN84_09885 [Luteolibacter yonseiensis]|uniref:Plant Basic Secretory Protein n=1 Tax=Luteolibacter yonseiensis TaxID=1144680 RepID=A0A934R6A3_9BACT|nr:basic secretory protein-like protein [Luteolibacter yonseiensis]MBK1815929.1 hypothetical protein [Luteolibacter yonseiensis]